MTSQLLRRALRMLAYVCRAHGSAVEVAQAGARLAGWQAAATTTHRWQKRPACPGPSETSPAGLHGWITQGTAERPFASLENSVHAAMLVGARCSSSSSLLLLLLLLLLAHLNMRRNDTGSG